MPSRRRFLAASAAAGTTALAGCSALPFVGSRGRGAVELDDDYPADVTPDSGWASARRDAANTACAPDGATLAEPAEQWRSPPVPIQSTVFARRLTVAGATVLTGGGALVAYDAVSGDRLWTQDEAFPSRHPVPVADGVAWAPAPDSRAEAVGVDAATGDVARRADLPSPPTRPPVPVFGDYGLYAVAPAGPGLVGFDPESGERSWTRRVFGRVREPPAVTPELIAATTTTGELYAFSRRGVPKWRVNPDQRLRGAPVVGSERVYAASGGGVLAFENLDGREAWRAPDAPATVSRTLALGDGGRVFGAGDEVYALSAATGELAWERSLPDTAAGLAVGGDSVYVAAGTRLLAFSRGGSERWRLDLGGDAGAAVAVTENRLYTFVTDGEGRTRILALA